MGLKKKKRREHCSRIELVLPERRREKETAKNKDSILGRRGKSVHVRTFIRVRHFPDLPCGEITIEGISFVKHCTTATTKKSPRIKMGLKKKRGESIVQK